MSTYPTQEERLKWKREIEQALGEGCKIITYKQAANAFPSPEPNPFTFDAPLLDIPFLKEWAKSRGYEVRPLDGVNDNGSKNMPSLCFTRVV